jgi:cold shock CspA family protein
MNSAVEDIFAFKTCCGVRVFDQNLEILITNKGKRLIRIPSYFDMEEESVFHRVDTLLPHGERALEPGQTVAFYCTMDETRWKKVRQIVFYDTGGDRYPVKIDID